MDEITTLKLFSLVALLFSVVIHEVAHGYAALFQGDPTAKYEGRLTLNPIKHMDPIGSVLVPIVTSLAGVGFGWAKPVPFNPFNLRNKRWGEAFVAFAGPASNLVIAAIFGIVIRVGLATGTINEAVMSISAVICLVNIALAVFNLIPFPPLDGSKILFAIIPQRFQRVREQMEQYALVLMVVLVFVLWRVISPVIYSLFALVSGL